MSTDPHLLVVDDDARLRELLRAFLARQGFRVTIAEDSAAAEQKLKSFAFDLLVLDVMMPGEDGIKFTQRLRGTTDVPILLLTAMGEATDRITGLASGADDYLVKPFEPDELLLRIRAILRRAPAATAMAVAKPAQFGPFVFDPEREQLAKDGANVYLTTAESSLLRVLAQARGQALTRADLIERTKLTGGERNVDVQVTRLRRKIEDDPRAPRYILTVRGEGYRLLVD